MARGGLHSPRNKLTRQLKRQVWPEGQARRGGLAYRGPADFVLQHGEWFDPQPLPAHIARGLPKNCYGNSLNAAVVYDLDYVEGWALDPGVSAIAFAHAWNCDSDRLIDVTWTGTDAIANVPGRGLITIRGSAGAAYLGVRFSVERADDATWNGDACILDDWLRGWPVLRSPWAGEPVGLDWPVSKRLEALRVFRAGDRAGARRILAEAHAEL